MYFYNYSVENGISIHSLRVEGDSGRSVESLLDRHFNPLPPCGGRLTSQYFGDNVYISIHSLRVEGDQEPRRCDTGGALISIHSLRVEGDLARLRAR